MKMLINSNLMKKFMDYYPTFCDLEAKKCLTILDKNRNFRLLCGIRVRSFLNFFAPSLPSPEALYYIEELLCFMSMCVLALWKRLLDM